VNHLGVIVTGLVMFATGGLALLKNRELAEISLALQQRISGDFPDFRHSILILRGLGVVAGLFCLAIGLQVAIGG
jgi:hypothetical protein